MTDRSEKSLSLLNWKLLCELDEAKHKRFEWVLKNRESIFAGWRDANIDLNKWRQRVNNEIAQLVAEGHGAAAERLAESLLREPQSYDGPNFDIVVPTGHGVEVWSIKGVSDQALAELVATPSEHPPPKPDPSSPTKKSGHAEPITAGTNGSSLVGFTQPISQTSAPGKPALACPNPPAPTPPPESPSPDAVTASPLPSVPRGTVAASSVTTKLPPPAKEPPAKSPRRRFTQAEFKDLVRKRVSASEYNSWDYDKLRDELSRRNIPVGKLRTRVQMTFQLARSELLKELHISESEDDGEGPCKSQEA